MLSIIKQLKKSFLIVKFVFIIDVKLIISKNSPPGERDKARLPSLRLFIGLCSDSLLSRARGEAPALLSERPLSASSSCSGPRLRARGTASEPLRRRGRPRFRLGPRLKEDGLREEEAVWSLLMEPSGLRREGWRWGTIWAGGRGSPGSRGAEETRLSQRRFRGIAC